MQTHARTLCAISLIASAFQVKAAEFRDPFNDLYQLRAGVVYSTRVYDFQGKLIEEVFHPNDPVVVENPIVVSEFLEAGVSNSDTVFGVVNFEGFSQIRLDGFMPTFRADLFTWPIPAKAIDQTAFWGSFNLEGFSFAELRDEVLLVSPGQSGFGTLLLGFESTGLLSIGTSRSSQRTGGAWQITEINTSAQLLAESGIGPVEVVFDDDVRGSELDPPGTDGYIDPFTKNFSAASNTDSLFIVSLPFEYGVPFDLEVRLDLFSEILITNIDVADSFVASTTADYGNTVRLVSASVLDSQGRNDDRAVVTSSLGIRYLEAVTDDQVSVPNAQTIYLSLLGLVALFLSRLRIETLGTRGRIALRQ